jgi:hypothetical protein
MSLQDDNTPTASNSTPSTANLKELPHEVLSFPPIPAKMSCLSGEDKMLSQRPRKYFISSAGYFLLNCGIYLTSRGSYAK